MAGVFGFVGRPSRSTPAETVESLSRLLTHSEYQKVDIWTGDAACLGVVHLGVLHDKPQPALDERTGARLVLDGEISEPDAIRRRLEAAGHRPAKDAGEPELLLALYTIEGAEALTGFDGSWTVAILSGAGDELTLITDRFGSRQLMTARLPWGIAFFPELKGALAFDDLEKTIDSKAITEFFLFRHPLREGTFLENVSLVPAASISRYRKGSLARRVYWRFEFPERYPVQTVDDWVDGYIPLLKRAVGKRLEKPPRAGTTLSGGNDTRLIIAGTPTNFSPLHTFTFGPRRSYDRRFARKIARAVDAVHHDTEMTADEYMDRVEGYVWFSDGMVPAGHGHIAALFPLVRKHVDVLLEGLPGASGVLYTYGMKGRGILTPVGEEEYVQYQFDARCRVPPGDLANFLHEPFVPEDPAHPSPEFAENFGKGWPLLAHNRSILFSFPQHQRRFSIVGARYLRTVVEVRQPFIDYDLFDYALTIPANTLVTPDLPAYLLRRCAPKLARIPFQATGLPYDPTLLEQLLFWRKNQLKRWIAKLTAGGLDLEQGPRAATYGKVLTGKSGARIEAILTDRRLDERGILKAGGVRRILDDNRSGRAARSLLIWSLFSLELWCRQFFDGEREGLGPG